MSAWLAGWLEAGFMLAGLIGICVTFTLPNTPRRSIAFGPIVFGMTMGHLTCKLFINPDDTQAKWLLLVFSGMGLLIGLGALHKLTRAPVE